MTGRDVVRFCRIAFLIVAGALAAAGPASAKIVKSKRSASSTWSPLAPLTIGSGFEYESDDEQSQSDFPVLLEYNFTENLKLTVEPDYVSIRSKSEDVRSVSGFGDLETSLEYEFLRERRYRPALSAEALVRWPTAADPDLGSPGTDYSLGIIASKDLVTVDLDLNLLYTFVGDHEQRDVLETSLAAEWHLSHRIDLEAEVLTTFGTGGVRGTPGTIGGFGRTSESGTEGTLGLAWHVSDYLKLEAGAVLKSGGSWSFVAAWEWSFSGRD